MLVDVTCIFLAHCKFSQGRDGGAQFCNQSRELCIYKPIESNIKSRNKGKLEENSRTYQSVTEKLRGSQTNDTNFGAAKFSIRREQRDSTSNILSTFDQASLSVVCAVFGRNSPSNSSFNNVSEIKFDHLY